MPTAAQTVDILYQNRRALLQIGKYSEADTVLHLIDPVLEYLGYPATHQTREAQKTKNRPDIVLWPTTADRRSTNPADAILEAKPLDADLDGTGLSRSDRPKSQIKRYLIGYPHSGTGTYGILTDGNIWHIIRRGYADSQTQLVREWRLFSGNRANETEYLREIAHVLRNPALPNFNRTAETRTALAREVCTAIAEGKRPNEILQTITGNSSHKSSLAGQILLQGKALEAETIEWSSYAYTEAGRIKVDQLDTSHEVVAVAVVQTTDAETDDDAILYRQDVAIAASTFAKTVPTVTSVILMIQPDVDGTFGTARLAVYHQGHTSMTTDFNPYTPAPMVLKSIQKICEQIKKTAPVPVKTLTDPVAAKGVREEFYAKVANGWTLRQQRKAKGNQRQRYVYREAVLRHLIRTIFAWILKEDGKLPPEAFDEAFANRLVPGDYHAGILTFLFHERLNKPHNQRVNHPHQEINQALSGTRFLNGSLFQIHQNDSVLSFTDDDYFGTDPQEPGLFTILGEYDWTAAEHTPHTSDQTIDPEVLSNLFENLIAATKFGEEVPDRMPAGTYYTPADVALEMVKDALTEAVFASAPALWSRGDVRQLLTDEPSTPLHASCAERNRLLSRFREITIFDPAVGSGEFPFICTLAIKQAIRKLGTDETDADILRGIVGNQIYAQDINPMAVQVTRLRLFIAITAAETPGQESDAKPLPNLEARIVCANTLGVVADQNWQPLGGGSLQAQVSKVNNELSRLAQIVDRWLSAHDEVAKQTVRREYETARRDLLKATRGKFATPETVAFAKHPLLDPDAPPVTTDPRLYFYGKARNGFDIIIGNPPYESVNKDLQPPPGANESLRKELTLKKQNRRKELISNKKYQTTAGNDLYNLFAEAAMVLAKPVGGIVELVMPLSLSFGQDQTNLRRLFETHCQRIVVRCQDIRPDKTFHDSPVEHPENSQRTTIVTATTGPNKPTIYLSGTNKWRKSERHEYWISRPRPLPRPRTVSVDTRIDSQWERVDTLDMNNLITAMKANPTKIRDLKQPGENRYRIGFPKSARYFFTAMPVGMLDRGEFTLPISTFERLELAVAASNCHAAFIWWKAFGDAYHVNPHEVETIAIPQLWIDDPQTNRTVRHLARHLMSVAPLRRQSIITGRNRTSQDTVDLHANASVFISKIDESYLRALNIPVEPVLQQLRVLRSRSTWKLGAVT